MPLLRNLTVFVALLPFSVMGQSIDSTQNETLSITQEWNSFRQGYNFNWHQTGLEYKRKLSRNTVLARFNYANRFDKNGWQAELEAYPKMSKKVYAYTGLAYSPTTPVFPSWRGGATLFVNLAGGWEAEGGFRYLRFNRDIWMATGGISKYLGNWLFQTKGFFTLNSGQELSRSYFATARYYLPSGTNYVWLQVGTGISPDESQAAQLQAATLQRQSILAGLRTSAGKRHQLTASLGWARNEYKKGTYGSQITGVLGYGVRF